MKLVRIAALGTALAITGALSGQALAEDRSAANAAPVELSDSQMDRITAGALITPGGNVVFENLDNPAPNETGYLAELLGLCGEDGHACHPALTRRSDQALDATQGHGPGIGPDGGYNAGPWSSAIAVPRGS